MKGVHLVEPAAQRLGEVSHWVLHESESIRYRRESAVDGHLV